MSLHTATESTPAPPVLSHSGSQELIALRGDRLTSAILGDRSVADFHATLESVSDPGLRDFRAALIERCAHLIRENSGRVGNQTRPIEVADWTPFQRVLDIFDLNKPLRSQALNAAFASAHNLFRTSVYRDSSDVRSRILKFLLRNQEGDELAKFWRALWSANLQDSNLVALRGLLEMSNPRVTVIDVLPDVLRRAEHGSLGAPLAEAVIIIRQKLSDQEVVDVSRGTAGKRAETLRGALRSVKFPSEYLEVVGIDSELLAFASRAGWPHQVAVSSTGGSAAFLSADRKRVAIFVKAAKTGWQVSAESPELPYKIDSADVYFPDATDSSGKDNVILAAYSDKEHSLDFLAIPNDNILEIRRVFHLADSPLAFPTFMVLRLGKGNSVLGMVGNKRPRHGANSCTVGYLMRCADQDKIFDRDLYDQLGRVFARASAANVQSTTDVRPFHKEPRSRRAARARPAGVVMAGPVIVEAVALPAPARPLEDIAIPVAGAVDAPPSTSALAAQPPVLTIAWPTGTDLFCHTDVRYYEKEIAKLAAACAAGNTPEGGWLRLVVPLAFACVRLEEALTCLTALKLEGEPQAKFAALVRSVCDKVNGAIFKRFSLVELNYGFRAIQGTSTISEQLESVKRLFSTLTSILHTGEQTRMLNWANYALGEFGEKLGSPDRVSLLRQAILGFYIVNAALVDSGFETRLGRISTGQEPKHTKPTRRAAGVLVDLLKDLRALQ